MAAVSEQNDDKDSQTPLEEFPKLKEILGQWTQCADCNQKDPKWAEISRGIFICLQCSVCRTLLFCRNDTVHFTLNTFYILHPQGVHRQLGTHSYICIHFPPTDHSVHYLLYTVHCSL